VKLTGLGYDVSLEPGAGLLAQYTDDDYTPAGASLDADALTGAELVSSVQPLSSRHVRKLKPGTATMAWLLAQGEDMAPIPGTKGRARLEENAADADVDLTAADLKRLPAATPRSAWAGDRHSFAAHHTTRSSA